MEGWARWGDAVMADEHSAALIALVSLPVAAMGLVTLIEAGARRGRVPALRLRDAYLRTAPAVRLAALAMAVSAAVHLALVPAHLTEDRPLGVLFALDAVALLVAAAWSLTRIVPGWRVAGVVLLLAGLLAYAGYVASGTEAADPVGVATKVAELAAAGLLVTPERLARSPLSWRSRPSAVRPHRMFGGLFR